MVLSLLTSILFVFDDLCIQNHRKNKTKNNFFFLNYATSNLTEFVEWPNNVTKFHLNFSSTKPQRQNILKILFKWNISQHKAVLLIKTR